LRWGSFSAIETAGNYRCHQTVKAIGRCFTYDILADGRVASVPLTGMQIRTGWWINEGDAGSSFSKRHRLRAEEADGGRRTLCGVAAEGWAEAGTGEGIQCPSCVEIEMDLAETG
jgi:hypothetical protein